MSSVGAMATAKPTAALDRMRSTALDLVALTANTAEARLRRTGPDGGWSPATVVRHLADAELVYAYRLRLVLTGDTPWLSAFDEAAWAERLADVDRDLREVLDRFRVLRDANLRLLAGVTPEEWDRRGVHADRGELTLAAIVEVLAEHDRDHLQQIRRSLTGE